MKLNLSHTLMAAAALFTATAANAQTERSIVSVPFEFHAGPATLPAGVYRVYLGPMVTQFHNVANGKGIMLTALVNADLGKGAPRLVFRRYGNEYFLSEIWGDEGTHGKRVQPTRLEKEIQAKMPSGGEKVQLAVAK